MTNQTIEQAVEEFEEKFGSADYGINKFRQFDTDGIFLQDGTDWLRQALQAQRDAGAREFVSELRKVFMGDDGEDSYITLSARIALFIRKHEALTPPTK